MGLVGLGEGFEGDGMDSDGWVWLEVITRGVLGGIIFIRRFEWRRRWSVRFINKCIRVRGLGLSDALGLGAIWAKVGLREGWIKEWVAIIF